VDRRLRGHQDTAMSTPRPLTLALVGYGQAATLFHDAFAREQGVQFHWVVGRVPESASLFAQERGIARATTSLSDALDDRGVDAVVITTPHDLHYSQALQTLQAGKHAIVEVPMTMNYQEAKTLVDEAAKRKLLLSVPHISRYLDANIMAKRLIDAGDVGQIYQFVYRRLWLQRGIGHLFNRQRSWVDTVSWHHAAHPVDLVSWLLGEPIECVGAAIRHDPLTGSEVDLSATLVAGSGTLVTIAMSYNSLQNYMDTVVVGEHAVLEVEGFSRLKRSGIVVLEHEDSLQVQGRAYQRYVRAFIAGLRGQGPVPVSGAEILPTMEQLQRMHELAARLSHGAQRKEAI
jgi:2-hydroxy-4-carboxymuconate semialdehyde hemiacetal dehydrogenase